MSFDNTGALWLLALALPIVLVHFYRGRLRPVYVPSLLFWDQVLTEEERKSALQRLRHYASLILNLAALLLLVSILAAPSVRGLTHEPRRTAFVLDTTLSMAAGRRMEGARARIRQSLAALHRTDPVALFDSAGLLVPFTTDRGRLERALAAPPRWTRRPADVAAAARSAHPDAEVVVVGDRGPLPNAAITAAAIEGEDAVLTLEGFGISGPADLVVEADGKAAAESAARIPGVARVALPEAQLVRIAKPQDDQPVDDAAYFVAPEREPPPAVVLSDGDPDPFVLRFLHILAQEGLIGTIGALPAAEYPGIRDRLGEATLVLVCGGKLDALGPGVFLSFGAESPDWALGEAAREPAVSDWNRSHPLLEAIDPSPLSIRQARLVAGAAVVRSPAGALAAEGRGPGRAWVAFGFRLEESDLRLRPAFPLLLRNAARWARSGAARVFEPAVESGAAIENRFPLVPAAGRAVVEWTDGRRVSREEIDYRGGVLRHVAVLPGFYRVRAGARSEWVAVPCAPPEEADLSGAPPPEPPPAPLAWYEDLPYLRAAGALLVILLLGEWLLYQRGLI